MTPDQRETLNRVLATLMVGGGLGVGARSLMGIRNAFKKPIEPEPQTAIPQEVPVPLPGQPKMASVDALVGTGGLLTPAMPLHIGALAGGVGGGWKLVDWLMNKRRQMRLKGELEASRRQYEQALDDQYRATMMSKTGSAEQEASLDSVFDKLAGAQPERSLASRVGGAASGATNALIGTYLTLLLGSALGAGYTGYQMFKGPDPDRALQDALKKRRLMRAAPQPVYMYPKYVPPKEEPKAV